MTSGGSGSLVRKILTATVKGIDPALRQVRGLGTIQEPDRDGEVVLVSGVQFNLTDPTRESVKFCPDHKRVVIGSIVSLEKVTVRAVPALEFVAQFLPEGVSEEADRVYAEIVAGARDTFSLGFIVLEADNIPIAPGQTGRTYRRIELLEISSVVLASNRGAVTLEKGLDASL
jgi:hypothetical protein